MRVLVVGAGWCGLTAGLLLNRDGHEVVVVEKDAATCAPARAAWEEWQRPGVAQFRQPHLVLPGAHHMLEAELPEVNVALRGAGGVAFSIVEGLAALLPDVPFDDPEGRYVTVNARRPVLESVVAQLGEDVLEVRRGSAVAGLLTGPQDAAGIPHVTGVRLASEVELCADVVIDATGRRSALGGWLRAAGCQEPELEAEREGFTYYTQFFRSADGAVPAARGPNNVPIGTISLLTLPSDNGTWSVTVFVQSRDQQVKEVRRPDAFRRVVAACPLQAHWLEGEPVGGIVAMSGVMDQRRRFVRAGRPVATGVLAIGDSWASTNPSLGRGLSIGLLQVRRLRDALRMGLDPAKLALHWHRVSVEEFEPWYRSCVLADRDRTAEVDALRDGSPVPAPTDPTMLLRFAGIAGKNAQLLRGAFDITAVHTAPEQVLARPAVQEALAAVGSVPLTRAAFPGPDRAQLLSLIHG